MATITSGNLSATSPQIQYINSLQAYKYPDSSTVYGNYQGDPNHAFSSPQEYFGAGGAQDWSGIETRQRPTATPIASTPTSPLQTARDSYINSFTPSPSLTSSRESYLSSFNPTSALDAARQAYLNSLNPDQNLLGAKQKYNDFTNSVESGLNRIADKTIPMTFITGQQASLRRNSESTAKRLQGDIGLAEENARLGQDKARAALDFANTDFGTGKERALAALGLANEDFNTGQQKAEASLGFAQDDVTSKKANLNELANGYPFYKYPGSTQVFDSKTNQPLTYEQYKALGGVGNPGDSAFGDVFEASKSGTTSTKLLTPTEAKALGVPYGTTQAQAAALNITPTTTRKTGPTTTKVTLTQGTNDADNFFRSVNGSDGYVSPEDWTKAREAWIQDGLSVSDFYSKFKKYVNPADPQDYI